MIYIQIYPAIDIKDGRCVRLKQGRFDDITVFSDEPWLVAKEWERQGATFIHVVDLDGARLGCGYNAHVIEKIVRSVSVKVQAGGGVRTLEDIEARLKLGVNRVILGTVAVSNESLVREAISRFGEKIVIGVDAKDGFVAISGWEDVSKVDAISLCIKMRNIGVKTIIFTDISKDGMLQGVNFVATKALIDALGNGVDIIASGGVSSINDLSAVSEINASGIIIGKALYNGMVDLKQVISMFQR